MSTDYDGPERRRNPDDRRSGDSIHPLRWRLLTTWIIAFTILQMWFYGRVQDSRLESCQRQYASQRALIDAAYGPDKFLSERAIRSKNRAKSAANPEKCNIIQVPFWEEWI